MPRSYLMSWSGPPNFRWRKTYRGALYTVTCVELAADATLPHVMVYTKDGSGKAADEWWRRKAAGLGGVPAPARSREAATVAATVERWLGHQGQRRRAGQLGGGRADSNRVCLGHFRDWLGADAPVGVIDGGRWQEWYGHLAEKKAAGEWSASHVDRILQVARRFVKALWEWELIELPRNLDSRTLAFEVPARKVETFSAGELARLWGAVRNQSRLHVLLMLNCGMLAKDVSDLKQTEVDWAAGVITRKRSKTCDHEDVPVVRYQLWGRTFDLLLEYRSADAEVVLLTASGNRWIREIESGGRWSRSDSVRSCLRNYLAAAEVVRPVKALRATAATALAGHRDYKFYAQYFLGHSPRGVADRHYVVPSQAEFGLALAWLEGALGLGE